MRTLAGEYLAAGLSVLPAHREGKRAAVSRWKPYQEHLPTPAEVNAWFSNDHNGLCLITGRVSGHLEMIDFDLAGELFEPWCESVRQHAPGLLDRLVIEKTPSGGRHVVYRCDSTVCGNTKLAQRKVIAPDSSEVEIAGKRYVPRKDANGNWHVLLTMIETRGEGGLFLCDPTQGYELVQGAFTNVPVITIEDRDVLLSAAWSLNEYSPEPVAASAPSNSGELRPGDDFNARGDIREVLRKHGWTLVKAGDNEYWRRPGKTSGWSATLKNGVFYVFSSNASPFEPERSYAPFAVYTLLEHSGDYAAAASALRVDGYGNDPAPAHDVDISSITGGDHEPAEPQCVNPGTMPDELLRIPGFVSEVMDYTLEIAPYPNHVLSFCGALSLQALLAGRKVRDPGDNRTNIYLLGLAHSSAGKDWPRKTNTRILHEVGLSGCLGDKFASGEGVQDALFVSPSIMFQTDEIDTILQTINKAQDARHENMMSTLLTMYSSSNSVYPMRRKAGKESPGAIDQPCLVVFGTAIPNNYYQALSERMLGNGFFARMLILEGAKRGVGQEAQIRDLPERVIETARWWAEFNPGKGNLEQWHPIPTIIEQTEAAKRILIETRLETEAEYSKAEASNDVVGTTVWGRANEQVRKLSLIYAISENHKNPAIDEAAATWARRLVMHQVRRMLYMAQNHVAETPFQAECLKLMRKLREAPNRRLAHSALLKRMKVDVKTFNDLVITLEQRGDLAIETQSSQGRPGRYYRLVEGGGEA